MGNGEWGIGNCCIESFYKYGMLPLKQLKIAFLSRNKTFFLKGLDISHEVCYFFDIAVVKWASRVSVVSGGRSLDKKREHLTRGGGKAFGHSILCSLSKFNARMLCPYNSIFFSNKINSRSLFIKKQIITVFP